MLIEYSEELDNQIFREHSDVLKKLGFSVEGGLVELTSVANPGAAFDRRALTTKRHGDLVIALFNHPDVPHVTSYEGVLNQWSRREGTWPATIDTLTHLRGQRESSAFDCAERILDVGCGNGMAGMHATNKHSSIISVSFSDLCLGAVQTAADNRQFLRERVAHHYHLGAGFPKYSGRYDVAIASAVPATPGYPDLERPLNPLFEGTDFLETILREAPDYLVRDGKLIISHSSAGEQAFNEFALRHGARVDRVLFERSNFYRTEFLGDSDWVRFLTERGGIRETGREDHPYEHTVSVKEVSYP